MVSRLHFLFELHKSNCATAAEEEELMHLLLSPDNDEETNKLLGQSWEDFEPKRNVFSETQSNKILHLAIASNSKKAEKIYSLWRWRPILKGAAAILLILSVGMLFIKDPIASNYQKLPATSNTNNQELKSKGIVLDKPTLTLADGSHIDLSVLSKENLLSREGLNITKTPDGQIVYAFSDKALLGKSSIEKSEYHIIRTPRGSQLRINLPDGSKVWLNAASSLKFPTTFLNSLRTVELIGEAYFEINQKKINGMLIPFKVVSNIGNGPNQEVEVLGTHFNVQAYENESVIKTTLLEGKVKVTNLGSKSVNILRPGQQAVMNYSSSQILHVDAEEIMGWKQGNFVFNNMKLADILRQLERWYDVEVDFKNVPDTRYHIFISNKVSLPEVLNMMEVTGGLRFKINHIDNSDRKQITIVDKP